jgi:hypothetical protein
MEKVPWRRSAEEGLMEEVPWKGSPEESPGGSSMHGSSGGGPVEIPWKGLLEGFPWKESFGGCPLEGVTSKISPPGGPLEGVPSRGATEVGLLDGVLGWAVGRWSPGIGLLGSPMEGSPRRVLWKESPGVCPVEGMPWRGPLVGVSSRRSPRGVHWRGHVEGTSRGVQWNGSPGGPLQRVRCKGSPGVGSV